MAANKVVDIVRASKRPDQPSQHLPFPSLRPPQVLRHRLGVELDSIQVTHLHWFGVEAGIRLQRPLQSIWPAGVECQEVMGVGVRYFIIVRIDDPRNVDHGCAIESSSLGVNEVEVGMNSQCIGNRAQDRVQDKICD